MFQKWQKKLTFLEWDQLDYVKPSKLIKDRRIENTRVQQSMVMCFHLCHLWSIPHYLETKFFFLFRLLCYMYTFYSYAIATWRTVWVCLYFSGTQHIYRNVVTHIISPNHFASYWSYGHDWTFCECITIRPPLVITANWNWSTGTMQTVWDCSKFRYYPETRTFIAILMDASYPYQLFT